VLAWRPLAFLGTISYGIYLMHMLAANIVWRLLGHKGGFDVFVGTCLVVFLMAGVSYRYFESPILRLKDRFKAGSRPSPMPAVAAAP
jgi:peptidoglycan/LPS O-acetylase OafA/YrhL